MATDNSIISQVETWAIGVLQALVDDAEVTRFKTVDHWKHQIGEDNSGTESIDRFAPFAFVKCVPLEPERAGGYELNDRLRLMVAIGQKSKANGVARLGDANHLGTNQLRDLVIAALEDQHPGGDLTCDEFHYNGGREVVDRPRQHGLELYFDANNI